ncbi:MAG: hypothetical protein HOC74_18240 [Gemmatimonadetes bacterium]|jgi:hypothetical protein|nr:hypothetical protein [Gemmatimonadota bacterium]
MRCFLCDTALEGEYQLLDPHTDPVPLCNTCFGEPSETFYAVTIDQQELGQIRWAIAGKKRKEEREAA